MENAASSSKKDLLRVVQADFVTSAPSLKACPPSDLPEIAIVGRSNVGKSSLINLLCNRKSLAKTSSTPGKTQLINFFHLRVEPGDLHMHLVDLPGYGYSKVSKSVSQEWGKMMEEYLQKRQELLGIIQLIDSRHPPTALDHQMRHWIIALGKPSIVVLTKVDKLKRNEVAKSKKTVKQDFLLPEGEPLILTSATERQGVQELLEAVVFLINETASLEKDVTEIEDAG